MKPGVAIVRCSSYDSEIAGSAVRRAVDLIGGIKNFIKPQSRVLVKPNILMAKEPEFGVDTHPEVVRAVIRLLKEIDCRIFVGDGPSLWGCPIESVDTVYEISGIKKICEEEAVDLVKFEKRRWRGRFPLTSWLDNCDHLVNIPKFKTHQLTLLTGAIKNLFGLVPGSYKTELHKNYFEKKDFAKILVDIYAQAKPHLTVIDGIIAMEGDGPATAGKLRSLNLLLAGADCVALDSVLALIMGIEPQSVLTTKEAARRGLGVAEVSEISVYGEKLEDVVGEPFLLPSASVSSRIPPIVVKIAKKFLKSYPCVERGNCVRCAACVSACPNKAIKMDYKGIRFDYSKCIACFCCQEACPSSALKTRKSLLSRLTGF